MWYNVLLDGEDKMIPKLILCLLTCFIISGCATIREVSENDVAFDNNSNLIEESTKAPFTGIVVKHYPNGKIGSKQSYKDGIGTQKCKPKKHG